MFDSSFRYGVTSFRRFVVAFRRFGTPILLVGSLFSEVDSACYELDASVCRFVVSSFRYGISSFRCGTRRLIEAIIRLKLHEVLLGSIHQIHEVFIRNLPSVDWKWYTPQHRVRFESCTIVSMNAEKGLDVSLWILWWRKLWRRKRIARTVVRVYRGRPSIGYATFET